MLDFIPLREIIAIENCTQALDGRLTLERAENFEHSFQIRTIPDGHNSGRKYILQAENDLERNKFIAHISSLTKLAKMAEESPFNRTQKFVKKIYNSDAIQGIAASLIVLVSLLRLKIDPLQQFSDLRFFSGRIFV